VAFVSVSLRVSAIPRVKCVTCVTFVSVWLRCVPFLHVDRHISDHLHCVRLCVCKYVYVRCMPHVALVAIRACRSVYITITHRHYIWHYTHVHKHTYTQTNTHTLYMQGPPLTSTRVNNFKIHFFYTHTHTHTHTCILLLQQLEGPWI